MQCLINMKEVPVLMSKLKKAKSIERLKSHYGFMFCLPWLIGVALFFILPLMQSIIYSFSNVTLEIGGLSTKFSGLSNYKYILSEDADYTNNLGDSISNFLYSFPLIMILSLILGILLNQKFKGRVFFRALYFLPVIIATGVVMEILFTTRTGSLSTTGTDESVRSNMISVGTVIDWLGLPATISGYFNTVVSAIMDLVWSCGIQIVLWISGMQAIPDLLYEVAKVEGATKWEEFWFITFPMLSRVTVLVAVFTMVELITAKTDLIMSQSFEFMQSQRYGQASAMLWIYFIVIGASMGLLVFAYNRFCAKRWE